VPAATRVWVDETYVEYLGPGQSLEHFAAHSEQVIVCKSMSKVYALSGARVAYLCAGPHQLEEVRSITPPWVVSLPAQLAAIRALENPAYYTERYAETAILREHLAQALVALGIHVHPGVANFLLCELPAEGPDTATVVRACRCQGVFLRQVGNMGTQFGSHTVRIAVKDSTGNATIVAALAGALSRGPDPDPSGRKM
jgi:histidinol-phosphate/aromatic aminotransferase/cobyric acid decarboxylase-like protein